MAAYRLRRALALLTALAAVLGLCAVAVAPAASARPSFTASHAKPTTPVRNACAPVKRKGLARCFALIRTDIKSHRGLAPAFTPAGFGAADLKDAYKLPTASGGGQTVAIVDAFDDPNAESDLAVYRAQYGLPACTTANGCFRKVNQEGAAAPLPQPDAGWAGEITLDVDMVSAACPLCHILLVEADDNANVNLAASVDTAVGLGAKYVSNSYGSSEDPSQTDSDAFYDHPGVVVTASTGDDGFGTSYPATAPGVTAVGGTSLTATTSNTRGWTEAAWDGAGSGCSSVTPKPSFQHDPGCANKSVADVSAVADPATGVAVYNTFQAPGWDVYGGTSASSPLIASVYALAGTPGAGTNPESYPYAHPANLFDVRSGSNGSCDPSYLCTAGHGYDGPTGLGTPNGAAAFRAGPRGNVVGKVKNAATGAPIAGAEVSTTNFSTVSNADGTYTLNLPAGARTVTAAAYGYNAVTKTPITVVDKKSVRQDFALTAIPTVPVSGNVVDGSGHGWPLYASISIDGAPGAPVFSNPFTGHYQLSIPRGTTQTVTVTPKYAGYPAKSFHVQVGASAQSRDLAVPVQSDCAAPGYTARISGLQQHFDTTSKPAGWSVKDLNGSGGVWVFNDPKPRGNTTGGSGDFAIIDSDFLGSGNTQDTALVTPSVDLSHNAHPVVGLNTFYRGFSNSTADIDYTVNGGATWTNVFEATTDDVQGPLEIALPNAANKPAVQVRFRYRGEFAWWWEVDDVYVGQRSCAPVPGGIVAGFVKDANTGLGVVGATVRSQAEPAQSGTSAATPNNPSIADGFYHLYSSKVGTSKFTASKTGYGNSTKTVTVPSNFVVRSDYSLTAGQITAAPAGLAGTTTLGGTARTTMTLHNRGARSVHVKLAEGTGTFVIADKPAAAAYRGVRGAAVRTVAGHYSPLREKPSAGRVQPTRPSAPSDDPWQAIADYPTPISNNSASVNGGLVYSVGGYDGSDDVAALYSFDPSTNAWTKHADMSTTREAPASGWINGILYVSGGWGPDGSPTDITESYDPGADAWTTLAPNPKPHAGAGTAVLDGKLYLIGGCDDTCGSTDVEVYDPATDSWSSGTDYPNTIAWESCGAVAGAIYCAGGTDNNTTYKSTYSYDGTSWTKLADLPVDEWGGAYAAANGALVVSGGVINDNSGVTNQGWSYDPGSDAWTALPNSNNAFYRLGGACGFYKIGGSVSPADPAHAESEVLPGYDTCSSGAADVSWLSESKAEFDLAPGASKTILVTMDSSGLTQPGTYTATLTVGTDTPYPAAKIPVTFTVKPPATWGKISGVVLGTSCNGTSAPIAGATVEIDSWAAQYTLTTDADGKYALFLDYRSSPLTVIVAKDGWKPQTITASITAGGRTVRNFALKPAKACG